MVGLVTCAELPDHDIGDTNQLSPDELKAIFVRLTGTSLPKFIRGTLMRRAVAHAMRESSHGGLEPGSRKRLDQLARQIVPVGETPPPKPNRKIRSGTRLIREWQGTVHEVMVDGDSFLWKEERYRSLSEIARLITGTRWNGWVYFGLKKTGEGKAVPAKIKGHRTRVARLERRQHAGAMREEGAAHA